MPSPPRRTPPTPAFSRRTLALVATAVVLLGAFAALPAPKLIFRRSPTVADRIAGDVRRVALAMEPAGGVLHAILEVWTDSDWDVEYWSSIPALTPKARVVTNDLLEQRESSIAASASWLGLAYVTFDDDAERYTLLATRKRFRDRDWVKPQQVLVSRTPVTGVRVGIDDAGTLSVAFTHERRAKRWTTAGGVVADPGGPLLQPAPPLPPGARGCCAATAARGDRAWTAWLEPQRRKGIFRVVRLRYSGEPGPFTQATTMDVTALVAR